MLHLGSFNRGDKDKNMAFGPKSKGVNEKLVILKLI